MEDILYDYEDMLVDELRDIMEIKKSGNRLSEQDICNGEKILKSMEHIERIVMLSSVDPDEYENNNSSRSYSNSGYNRSYGRDNYGNNQYSKSYRSNNYGHRYGHDVNEFRAEIEKRMNMAPNENERMVYANWLNELGNQH